MASMERGSKFHCFNVALLHASMIHCCVGAVVVYDVGMPKALDVDWSIIRACFVAGATLEELSAKFGIPHGTLGARSAREKWMDYRPERVLQTRANEAAAMAGDVWADRAQRHRESMGRITDRLAKHVETLDDTAILSKVEKLKVVDDIARRNLGLDTQSNPTLNLAVGLLAGASDIETVRVVSDFEGNLLPESSST